MLIVWCNAYEICHHYDNSFFRALNFQSSHAGLLFFSILFCFSFSFWISLLFQWCLMLYFYVHVFLSFSVGAYTSSEFSVWNVQLFVNLFVQTLRLNRKVASVTLNNRFSQSVSLSQFIYNFLFFPCWYCVWVLQSRDITSIMNYYNKPDGIKYIAEEPAKSWFYEWIKLAVEWLVRQHA